MFVAYEASISLSIGLASTAAQSVEVSLVNYLWPTLLVLMTAAVSHKRGAVWKALPGAIVATIGVAMAVGGESLCRHCHAREIPDSQAADGIQGSSRSYSQVSRYCIHVTDVRFWRNGHVWPAYDTLCVRFSRIGHANHGTHVLCV